MTGATIAMKLGTLAALGTVVGRVVYAVARTPSRTAKTTGLRGLKRRRAITDSEAWATIEPFVRWLGARLRGLLTDEAEAAVDRRIALAGDYLGLVAEEMLALSLLAGVVGVGVGALVAPTLGLGALPMIVLGLLGPALPWIRLSDVTRVRLTSISRSMPYVVDLIALAVGAGSDFPGAIRQVTEKAADPADPTIEELALILQSLRIGRTRRSALLELAARAPVEAVRELSSTVIQAEEQGHPIEGALGVLAGMARLRRSIEAEERASQAGVAMMLPLGLMFLAVIVIGGGPAILGLDTMFP